MSVGDQARVFAIVLRRDHLGATVRRSVLSPSVHVQSYADVEGSVVFSGAEIGREGVVRKAIIDNDVVLEPGAQVGVDVDAEEYKPRRPPHRPSPPEVASSAQALA